MSKTEKIDFDIEELEILKQEVLIANLLLSSNKLAALTWGNVSGINTQRTVVVIKPSGVSYEEMGVEDMVCVSLESGEVLGNTSLKPSTDLPTHLVLYKKFPQLKGITHTHSTFATSWAQAGREIPCLGTTHADNVLGPLPITRDLLFDQVKEEYEKNTGIVIVEELEKRELSVGNLPGILVKEHGVFAWSLKNARHSVENAIAIEEIAKIALFTQMINPHKNTINESLKEKHFQRKHGHKAYYGQKKPNK